MERSSEPGEVAGLVSFLEARLHDDEAFMRAAMRLRESGAVTSSAAATEGAFSLIDLVMNDPDVAKAVSVFTRTGTRAPGEAERVLVEVETKRAVLVAYRAAETARAEAAHLIQKTRDSGRDTINAELDEASAIHERDALYGVLRLLALPYADHPGYQEGWRP